MKTTLVFIFSISLATSLFSQPAVSISDLESLNNTSWSGNLMYVNYSDGKEVNLRTTMQIEIKGERILMNTQFTDEPGANRTGSIKLKKEGTYFGNEKIIEYIKQKDGTLKIVTKFDGKDANKPATMFKTYLISDRKFSITKTVKFYNSNEVFVRNRYTYNKI